MSFEDVYIKDLSDINCFIGKNNVGKSNVLKAIDFFYRCLKGEVLTPLPLFSNYSNHGSISIEYDTNRLESVVRSGKKKSPYQRHIYSTLYQSEVGDFKLFIKRSNKGIYRLTLKINRDNSLIWSEKNQKVREIIHRVFPFFSIDTRRLDLYNWKYLWDIVSKLKFLNTKALDKEKVIDFFDSNVSDKSNSYKEYVRVIEDVTKVAPYDYNDLIFNYIKVGLKGHKFNIDGNELNTQSDGSNSFRYIEVFLNLIISLTRREFITPTVFIDEPEIGLHPKKCEMLIHNLNEVYRKFKSESDERQVGKYKTPYPTIIITTHSPNILKSIIKLFPSNEEHKVIHFSKKAGTMCKSMNSVFLDRRFVNLFSDNEARLFFSDFILFVEGDTEQELFSNSELISAFPVLSRLDVYRTNLVMLKAIRPSSSNVAIPYLVLYDADKILKFNKKNNSLNFFGADLDLFALMRSKRISLWGSRNHDLYQRLNLILTVDGVERKLSPENTRFEKFSIKALIQRINRVSVHTDRIFFAENTIEGVLINKKSIRLIKRWIIVNYINGLRPSTKGDVNIVIKKVKSLFIKTRDFFNSFKRIFTNRSGNSGSLELSNEIFSDYIKVNYLKMLYKKFRGKVKNDEDLVIIFRLAFEGKTDTLLSSSNEGYSSFIGPQIRQLVEDLKQDFLSQMPISCTKTGGWVSSFLTFSISHLKSSTKNQDEFEAKFRFYFLELYDIIDEISSSID